MQFNYFAIGACLVLVAFLFFKEISRKNKSQLVWRLIASLLMVVSLVLLIIPITYTQEQEEPVNELNLITEGADFDKIVHIKAPKYTLDSLSLSLKTKSSINFLADLAYHLKENEIKKVNIYGYGLKQHELTLLKDKQVQFYPSALPSGIITANWPRKLKATQSLTVQGIYHNPIGQKVKLMLYGMGSVVDSAIINANAKVKFTFSTQPKQMGKAVYQIIALRKNDTLFVEPIPFEVSEAQKLNVLILASFPDFEYKFLKNWLYENQYPVIFRSQISKDKYSTDFLNAKAINVSKITSSSLNKIDLIIIDEDEFTAIAATERAAIDGAVNQGMGLVVRLTNAKPNKLTQSFKRLEIVSPAQKTLRINSTEELTQFNELPFGQTLFLQPTANEQPVFKAVNGNTVVNSQIKGMGKVLVSSLAATYQWELAGNKADYANFWTTVIKKAARKTISAQSFEISPSFLTIGEQARLIVSSTDEKRPFLQFNQVRLAPRQNIELGYKWDGTFWPITSGWNEIKINKQTENTFVYKNADWKNLRNENKLNATTNFVAKQLQVNSKEQKMMVLKTEELTKWWFFAIFLLSASFLWYEQRFLAKK